MPFRIGLAKKREKQLQKELNRLISEIIKLDPEKIILFGSCASGQIHKSSDIDIIIVVRDTQKRFLDRLEHFYKLLKPKVATDLIVYSPEEFEYMKDNSFIKNALKNGRIIYEKQKY